MNIDINNILKIQALTNKRVRGGWIAVTPAGTPVKFGVIGNTEDEALNGFLQAAIRWNKILAGDHGMN